MSITFFYLCQVFCVGSLVVAVGVLFCDFFGEIGDCSGVIFFEVVWLLFFFLWRKFLLWLGYSVYRSSLWWWKFCGGSVAGLWFRGLWFCGGSVPRLSTLWEIVEAKKTI